MIQLRDAQFSDYDAIARLHAASWKQTYRGIYSNQFLDHEVEQNRAALWHNRLSEPSDQQQIVVAEKDGIIVGFACLFLNDDNQYGTLLDNLHISANWQKAGIGKQLLQECAHRILLKAQSPKMYLWVYESNENARKVYERLGAKHLETVEQPTVSGTTAPACRYAWSDAAVLLAG